MSDKPSFFVGYLPIPADLKSFFQIVIPLLLLAALGAAAWYGSLSPSAGTGVWETEPVTLTGTLKLDPYPMLVTEDTRDRPILVVSGIKLSARPFLEGLDGKTVSLTGTLIHRGLWQMLTVEDGSFVAEADGDTLAFPEATRLDPVSMTGEVVDSKCMLGAMRPGVGKVHRACASLCLMGGLPPMLLVRGEGEQKVAYLLVGPNGEPLSEPMSEIVARPVEISGTLERWGSLPVLRTTTQTARLLDGPELLAFGPSIGTGEGAVFCRIS